VVNSINSLLSFYHKQIKSGKWKAQEENLWRFTITFAFNSRKEKGNSIQRKIFTFASRTSYKEKKEMIAISSIKEIQFILLSEQKEEINFEMTFAFLSPKED